MALFFSNYWQGGWLFDADDMKVTFTDITDRRWYKEKN